MFWRERKWKEALADRMCMVRKLCKELKVPAELMGIACSQPKLCKIPVEKRSKRMIDERWR